MILYFGQFSKNLPGDTLNVSCKIKVVNASDIQKENKEQRRVEERERELHSRDGVSLKFLLSLISLNSYVRGYVHQSVESFESRILGI